MSGARFIENDEDRFPRGRGGKNCVNPQRNGRKLHVHVLLRRAGRGWRGFPLFRRAAAHQVSTTAAHAFHAGAGSTWFHLGSDRRRLGLPNEEQTHNQRQYERGFREHGSGVGRIVAGFFSLPNANL